MRLLTVVGKGGVGKTTLAAARDGARTSVRFEPDLSVWRGGGTP